MSAPFELLVAIIIMGFVVIIGSQMLTASQNQICRSGIDKELTEFKSFLEDTTQKKSTNKFTFIPEDICFNTSQATIRIAKYADTKICASKCPFSAGSCFVLMFSANLPNNQGGMLIEKCLNIPEYTNFTTSDECNTGSDLSSKGYKPINPGDDLPLGQYVLKSVSLIGQSYPSICVFYQKS